MLQLYFFLHYTNRKNILKEISSRSFLNGNTLLAFAFFPYRGNNVQCTYQMKTEPKQSPLLPSRKLEKNLLAPSKIFSIHHSFEQEKPLIKFCVLYFSIVIYLTPPPQNMRNCLTIACFHSRRCIIFE